MEDQKMEENKEEKPKVTIYTTPTCTWCKKVKEFFKEHDVKYKEIDVSKDRDKAQEMVEKSGQMGVPVIEIGDKIIIGFDKENLMKALDIKE